MKRITLFIACLLAATTADAADSTAAQIKVLREISGVASAAVSAYKEHGMHGLQSMSQECWEKVERYEFKCLRIDLAARYIDRQAGGGSAFPLNPYFDDEEFGKRAWPLFQRKNADVAQANDYLRSMQVAMNGAVDKKMAGMAR